MVKSKKKIMVIDGGARGQALAYGLAKSKQVGEVILIPGNGGSSYLAKLTGKKIYNAVGVFNTCDQIVEFAKQEAVDLVVVGPETWLEKGLGDALLQAGISAIAPIQDVARLETDKAWMREHGTKWGVPQPRYKIFTDVKIALDYIRKENLQEGVRKVAYPAGGKGVAVCRSQLALVEAVKDGLIQFGDAAKKFLIEELIPGVEVSYIGYTDGTAFVPWVTSMDHKEIYPGGPMTGGMGVIAPNPYVTRKVVKRIEERIIYPILKGMEKEVTAYVGFFYAGVMLTKGKSGKFDEPVLIEVNARGGDPETLNEMHLLKTDLFDILSACNRGKLKEIKVMHKRKHSAVIVLAAAGYPGKPTIGDEIKGIDAVDDPDVVLFHAGTKMEGGKIITSGGRVLDVAAQGDSLEKALAKAKSVIGIKGIHFDKMYWRKDVGKLALKIVKTKT